MTESINDIEFTNWITNLKINLLYYGSLTLIPFGFVSNLLIAAIFSRKKFHSHTMGFYHILTAGFNSLTMLLYFAIYFSQAIGQDVALISNSSCKFFTFSLRLSTQILSWLCVFLTIDRVVSIYYQNKFQILKNRIKLFGLISLMTIGLVILNTPNFLYYLNTAAVINTTANSTKITRSCTADSPVVRARDTIVLLVRYAIPLCVTTVLNAFLIYKLFKIKNNVNSVGRKDYIFALSLTGLNALFITSLLPNFSVLIYLNTIQYEQKSLLGTRKLEMANIYNLIAIIITTLNSCLNIFVILIFNSLFRREFRNLIRESFRILKNKISISDQSTHFK